MMIFVDEDGLGYFDSLMLPVADQNPDIGHYEAEIITQQLYKEQWVNCTDEICPTCQGKHPDICSDAFHIREFRPELYRKALKLKQFFEGL
jgi:hypothetical protein